MIYLLSSIVVAQIVFQWLMVRTWGQERREMRLEMLAMSERPQAAAIHRPVSNGELSYVDEEPGTSMTRFREDDD